MAFTVDIDHAKSLAEAFKVRGVNAEATWGEDPDREQKWRNTVLARLRFYATAISTWKGMMIGACRALYGSSYRE